MLRRLLRVAAAGFCLLSLLACLVLACLWWRSYRVRDAREFDRRGVRWEVASDRGRAWLSNGPQLWIERAPLTEAERQLAVAERRRLETTVRLRDVNELLKRPLPGPDAPDERIAVLDQSVAVGLAAIEASNQAVAEQRDARARWWQAQADDNRRTKTPSYTRSITLAVPLGATALPPLLWLAARGRRRWVIRRRRRLGLCPRCGYDLRGSPPGGRCSECGAAAATESV